MMIKPLNGQLKSNSMLIHESQEIKLNSLIIASAHALWLCGGGVTVVFVCSK